MSDTRLQRTITLAGSERARDAAIAHARSLGRTVTVAVADTGGELVTFARMDGAPLLTVQIAQDKAWTAVAFGIPTGDWWELMRDDPALQIGMPKTERLIVFGGGVPLLVGGVVVGGIGVSGGSSDEDAEIARAGAAVIG